MFITRFFLDIIIYFQTGVKMKIFINDMSHEDFLYVSFNNCYLNFN